MFFRLALWALVASIFTATLGCGGSKLASVSLSPAVADAQNFPNGQVQFTATGRYSGSSKIVQLNNLTWCIGTASGSCNGNIASVATVSNGVAQCLPGAAGTATVLAGSDGHAGIPDTGFNLAVFGSAQLTCP